MGATPLFALNLVGWPRDGLPFDLLGEVLRGGADVTRAAGAFLLGGHSVDDPEPKYGDRKSTRLNSSHSQISYAVFCLKKKKKLHVRADLIQTALNDLFDLVRSVLQTAARPLNRLATLGN